MTSMSSGLIDKSTNNWQKACDFRTIPQLVQQEIDHVSTQMVCFTELTTTKRFLNLLPTWLWERIRHIVVILIELKDRPRHIKSVFALTVMYGLSLSPNSNLQNKNFTCEVDNTRSRMNKNKIKLYTDLYVYIYRQRQSSSPINDFGLTEWKWIHWREMPTDMWTWSQWAQTL